ncbi:PREDICTED: relaxin receptor 1-like [Branchiostoma belcheri]|uniref:Relaxin receptor 1-like n=1 Tax=Branchiostoma belcheri TaxID=7741 RepID=A0A6P5A1G6_BRABE|nr:PREDICTED: relaxin receptor 1-like [Branchiostoma belcheri]
MTTRGAVAAHLLLCVFAWNLPLLGADDLCPEGQFSCRDFNNTCWDLLYWCDDYRDCDNGYDENEFLCSADDLCPEGQFSCKDVDNTCLDQHLWCDETKDCDNGYDENELHCSDHGPGSIIDSREEFDPFFEFGKELQSYPDWCELPDVPEMCTCSDSSNVSCAGQNLTAVPDDISYNATRLYLQDNNIKRLPDFTFIKFTMLIYLNLGRNGLAVLEPDAFSGLFNLTKLSLIENRIVELQAGPICEDLPSLGILLLQGNRIEILRRNAFVGCEHLGMLEIDYNSISVLEKGVFDQMFSLKDLSLAGNKISHLPSDFFRSLQHLNSLNLSFNPFSEFKEGLFDGLGNLTSLDLKGITIKNINRRMFKDLTSLDHIYFSKFRYCFLAPHVRNCEPKTDGLSSFEDLLANVVLRMSVWVIAIVTCLGNTAVMIGRTVMKQENKVHSLFIKNLCASDFIMGVYLLVIATKDMMFRGEYHRHTHAWTNSLGCQITGFLAMLSAEVSVLLLTYMSVERFLCVVFPYRDNRPNIRQAAVAICLIWFFGLLLSAVPLFVPYYFDHFYGSNGVCFPLHLHEPHMTGWEYSAFVFLGVNFISVLVIAAAYVGMFISIQRTRQQIATHLTLFTDMSFAKRFFFIVLTDSLVWLPITVIKFIALAGIPISGSMYAWIVIFVLPINSAINPILYSLTTRTFTTLLENIVKGSPLSLRSRPDYEKAPDAGTTTGNTYSTALSSSYPLRPLRNYRGMHVSRSTEFEVSVTTSSCQQNSTNGIGRDPSIPSVLGMRLLKPNLDDVPELPSTVSQAESNPDGKDDDSESSNDENVTVVQENEKTKMQDGVEIQHDVDIACEQIRYDAAEEGNSAGSGTSAPEDEAYGNDDGATPQDNNTGNTLDIIVTEAEVSAETSGYDTETNNAIA